MKNVHLLHIQTIYCEFRMCVMCLLLPHALTCTIHRNYYKPTKYHKYGYSLLLSFLLVVAPSDMLLFDIALNPATGVLSFLKIPM